MSVNSVELMPGTLRLSRFVAGFWRQKYWKKRDSELQAYVEELLALGVTSMDHALVYRSEQQFGRVLKSAPSLREGMQIISKFGIRPQGFGNLGADSVNFYDSSPEHLRASVEQSLRDLNTDYLDLLLVHRPDFLMDARALGEAFSDLHASGKVRYFGVSNFSPSQFELLQSACELTLLTNQVEFSAMHLEPLTNGVFDQCQQRALKPMLWSCLAGGELLTGKSAQATRLRNAARVLADELGIESLQQIFYAWILALPCQPIPILGSAQIERIRDAVAAEKLSLSREQWYSIWQASTGHRVP